MTDAVMARLEGALVDAVMTRRHAASGTAVFLDHGMLLSMVVKHDEAIAALRLTPTDRLVEVLRAALDTDEKQINDLARRFQASNEKVRAFRRAIPGLTVLDTDERAVEIVAERLRATPGTCEQCQRWADAAEMLWVVLANVSGGDWTMQSEDWQQYAARWRDNYFAVLTAHNQHKPPTADAPTTGTKK